MKNEDIIREKIASDVNKFAGKIYGFDIVVADAMDKENKSFIRGFISGKKYMREEAIKLIENKKL